MRLNCTFLTFGIEARLNGIGGNVIRKALGHQIPNKLFEPSRLGNAAFCKQSRCTGQIVIRGKIVLRIARDIIKNNMTALKLGLDLALPPPAPFALLDKVRAKAILV